VSGKRGLVAAGVAALAAIALVPASSLYYESTGGTGCASCHEIQAEYDTWHSSTHRKIGCGGCHGDALTMDVGFHLNNLNRVIEHLRGSLPEQIHIRPVDVPAMLRRCQGCHRQEFADWQAGPHGVRYAKIFLNEDHNRKEPLMEDCLRCHGAYFPGSMRDLVAPMDRQGPWRMVNAALRDEPAIPCLSCHQMHRAGKPRAPVAAGTPANTQEIVRPSVALYDRRAMMYVPVDRLSLPQMLDGERPVKMSPDARQALCYQCHAAKATRLVGSGDDRTAIGVHEGISCLACHEKHGQQSRASCANCHPRLSNCGLDVEKMDTTFVSVKSGHNVHFVKCEDCHTKGVPRRRETSAPPLSRIAAIR
jgi:hypothetical protein